ACDRVRDAGLRPSTLGAARRAYVTAKALRGAEPGHAASISDLTPPDSLAIPCPFHPNEGVPYVANRRRRAAGWSGLRWGPARPAPGRGPEQRLHPSDHGLLLRQGQHGR